MFDLTNLLLIFLKNDAAQETNFEKDSSENAKVVVVSKTDHPSYNVGIIPMFIVDLILFLDGVQGVHVESLREGNQCLENLFSPWSRVGPIQIECEHFWKLLTYDIDCLCHMVSITIITFEASYGSRLEHLSKTVEEFANDHLNSFITRQMAVADGHVKPIQKSCHVHRLSEQIRRALL